MAPPPLPVTEDPELGRVRWCRRCAEWWPDEREFWINDAGTFRCRACRNELKAAAARRRRQRMVSRRRRGLCMVGGCPVQTPRGRCYYHSKEAA